MKQPIATQPALRLPEPPPPIERSAVFSGEQPNPLCRFILRHRWAPGLTFMLLGVNPSNAGADKEDPSSWRAIGFGQRWGYGGYSWCNPIPKISPSPTLARDWYRVTDRKARDATLRTNFRHIAAEAKTVKMVVICWGSAGAWLPDELTARLYDVLAKAGHRQTFCFGRTKEGFPTHPLSRGRNRLPDDTQPTLWRTA